MGAEHVPRSSEAGPIPHDTIGHACCSVRTVYAKCHCLLGFRDKEVRHGDETEQASVMTNQGLIKGTGTVHSTSKEAPGEVKVHFQRIECILLSLRLVATLARCLHHIKVHSTSTVFQIHHLYQLGTALGHWAMRIYTAYIAIFELRRTCLHDGLVTSQA